MSVAENDSDVKETIEVTEADLLRAQHREAREYVEFGMYEYIDPENFDKLAAEDLAIYQILARKKYADKLREVRTMVVTDQDALSRVAWQIEKQEMISAEIINEVFPEAGLERSPMFLGENQTMVEIDWYILHGLPDLINKLNVPALKTVSEEDIERLRQEATKQNGFIGNDSVRSDHFGFGVNGANKVK